MNGRSETAAFSSAADGVDPATVPQWTLYSGAKMPAIGLGTFGSDHAPAGAVAAAVIGAGHSSAGRGPFNTYACYSVQQGRSRLTPIK